MDSHRIEIRLIAGDGSWQYSWGADTGSDPNGVAAAARAYVSVLCGAASGAWPADNVQAMVERADREFPQFGPAASAGEGVALFSASHPVSDAEAPEDISESSIEEGPEIEVPDPVANDDPAPQPGAESTLEPEEI